MNNFWNEKQLLAVVGSQWGDEGKGKLVDILAREADVCCRYNGGSNAGHSLKIKGKKLALHLVPCGVMYPSTLNLLGNGMVVHLKTLCKEIELLKQLVSDVEKRTFVSSRAHLVPDFLLTVDKFQEEERSADSKIGTTCKGIGPTYASKMARHGIRFCDFSEADTFRHKYQGLFNEWKARFPALSTIDLESEIEEHLQLIQSVQIVDSVVWLAAQYNNGKKILAEGANAAFLDVDFGTYPFVTSSSTTAAGLFVGLGLPPRLPHEVIGVVKAYTTRVGEGPFPTELTGAVGDQLCQQGSEYGSTTGRKRRCGWFDAPMVRYASWLNGFDVANLTKLDVLTGVKPLLVCTHYVDSLTKRQYDHLEIPTTAKAYSNLSPIYKEFKSWKTWPTNATTFEALPKEAQEYVLELEKITKLKFNIIGTGADREEIIVR